MCWFHNKLHKIHSKVKLNVVWIFYICLNANESRPDTPHHYKSHLGHYCKSDAAHWQHNLLKQCLFELLSPIQVENKGASPSQTAKLPIKDESMFSLPMLSAIATLIIPCLNSLMAPILLVFISKHGWKSACFNSCWFCLSVWSISLESQPRCQNVVCCSVSHH